VPPLLDVPPHAVRTSSASADIATISRNDPRGVVIVCLLLLLLRTLTSQRLWLH
jgi:hypothetical protein